MTRLATACAIATALLTLLLTPACYTLLKHPRVRTDVAYEEVNDKQCNNCHAKAEIWSFHHSSPHPDRYTIGSNWFYFYDLPWWYNAYWYDVDKDDPSTEPYHPRPQGSGDAKNGAGIHNENGNNEATGKDTSKNRTVRPAAKTQDGEKQAKTD